MLSRRVVAERVRVPHEEVRVGHARYADVSGRLVELMLVSAKHLAVSRLARLTLGDAAAAAEDTGA